MRFWVHAKSRETVIHDASSAPFPCPLALPLAATARSPQNQAWVRDHMLHVSYRPTWGSVELVRAALALMQAAVAEDDTVQWLALASESCLPIVSLREVRRFPWLHSPCRSLVGECFVLRVICTALLKCVDNLTTVNRSWLLYDIPRSRYDHERKLKIGSMLSVVCLCAGVCVGVCMNTRCPLPISLHPQGFLHMPSAKVTSGSCSAARTPKRSFACHLRRPTQGQQEGQSCGAHLPTSPPRTSGSSRAALPPSNT